MTIAAGFLCTDGILLASDTLYSGVNKQYDRKIWPMSDATPTTTVALAGAGNAVLIRRARDEIKDRLSVLAESPQHTGVRDIVEGVLYSLIHKFNPHKDKEDFPLSLLVAVRTPEKCVLYRSEGDAVVAQIDKAATCIGWGSSLGLYVTESLYRIPMPARWAYVVAAHLIRLAKAYAADCDGDTHLFLLPNTGDSVFLDDQGEIARLEHHLARLDDAMRVVLPGGSFDASDFTLEHRLQEIVKAIEKVRNVAAGAGTATLQLRAYGMGASPEAPKKED